MGCPDGVKKKFKELDLALQNSSKAIFAVSGKMYLEVSIGEEKWV